MGANPHIFSRQIDLSLPKFNASPTDGGCFRTGSRARSELPVDRPASKEGPIVNKTVSKSFKTAREMLTMAEQFHVNLKSHWEKEYASVSEPGAGMLLDYIRHQEKKLMHMVSRYLRRAPDDILDTYFQFTPAEMGRIDEFSAWRPASGNGIEAIMESALEFDAFMRNYYRRAAEMASGEAIRDMFQNLANAVADKQKSQAQSASWLTDI